MQCVTLRVKRAYMTVSRWDYILFVLYFLLVKERLFFCTHYYHCGWIINEHVRYIVWFKTIQSHKQLNLS